MGTNNFLKTNAKYYYTLFTEDEVDNAIFNIKNKLKTYDSDNDFDDNRNYPGRFFLTKRKYFMCNRNQNEIAVQITTVIRNGYYDGVNLDFEVFIDGIKLVFNCHYNEEKEKYSIDNMCSYIPGYNNLTVAKKIQNFILKEVKEINIAYKENSTIYGKIASFSNGEAVYEKIYN